MQQKNGVKSVANGVTNGVNGVKTASHGSNSGVKRFSRLSKEEYFFDTAPENQWSRSD
jgi:hypothetical protein